MQPSTRVLPVTSHPTIIATCLFKPTPYGGWGESVELALDQCIHSFNLKGTLEFAAPGSS